MTGTGGMPLRYAANAGLEGGQRAQDFRDHMRLRAPQEDVIADSERALAQIKQQRSAAYEAGMIPVRARTQPLDFGLIDRALNDTYNVRTFHGVPLDESTRQTRNEITQLVADWKNQPAFPFHTAEGLDALKQKIWSDIQVPAENRGANRVKMQAYHAVRDVIARHADPQYTRVMQAYERAQEVIQGIEKTLSVNPKATVDTSLRKLQSVLRNNVNTAYGHRATLAEFLVNSGAPHLMEKLAGQAMNTWTPRGMARLLSGLGFGGSAALGLMANPQFWVLLGLLPFSSPRLMGEASVAVGSATRRARPVGRALRNAPLFQSGRLDRITEEQDED